MSLFPNRHVTQTDIDRAREELERANFKLGKARSRSIMSQAQASADATDLQACMDQAVKAENDFAVLAEKFVTPPAAEPVALQHSPIEHATQAANGVAPVGLDGEPLRDAFRQDA
jgi:hypothetical protein